MNKDVKTRAFRIITIDDEATIRQLVRHALGDEDYVIIEAANGREGLESIRQEMPDLIVMDVMMPEMNGLETLKAVRADSTIAHLPVLLLTGCKDSEKINTALKHPPTDYLAKPFNVDALRERVRKLIVAAKQQGIE